MIRLPIRARGMAAGRLPTASPGSLQRFCPFARVLSRKLLGRGLTEKRTLPGRQSAITPSIAGDGRITARQYCHEHVNCQCPPVSVRVGPTGTTYPADIHHVWAGFQCKPGKSSHVI